MNFSRKWKAVGYHGKIPLEVKQGMGCTRNFSTSGLYFVTDQGLVIGETGLLLSCPVFFLER